MDLLVVSLTAICAGLVAVVSLSAGLFEGLSRLGDLLGGRTMSVPPRPRLPRKRHPYR